MGGGASWDTVGMGGAREDNGCVYGYSHDRICVCETVKENDTKLKDWIA